VATIRCMDGTDFVAFVLIVAAAAGARVWYLSAAGESTNTYDSIRVQDVFAEAKPGERFEGPSSRGESAPTELDILVANLINRDQFACRPAFAKVTEDVVHVSPGYPYFLSVLERLRSNSLRADVLARWIQVGFGAVTAGLYYLTALIAFRSRAVGLLAGVFCALHPFWIVNSMAIGDGTLATFLLALAIFLGTRAGLAGGPLTSLLFGLSLAVLALVRAALLPFAFVCLLWLLLRCRGLPAGWMCGLLSVLGFVIGLAPWCMRNWQTFQEPVPIVNSAYHHLWMGNNPRATGGPMSEADMVSALDALPGSNLGRRLADAHSQTERYGILGQATLDSVRDDPAGCVRRRTWAGLDFFFGQQFINQPVATGEGLLGASSTFESLPAWVGSNPGLIFYASTFGMLLFGVLGWRWTYAWRRESRLLALAAIFVPLPYILSHAEALVGPRLPLDGVLLTFAAYALACMVPGVGWRLSQGPEPIEGEEATVRRSDEDIRHARL